MNDIHQKAQKAVAPLFTAYEHKGLKLKSRIVMAPMTRKKSPGGIPTPEVASYYARRARAGVGMIITEGAFVDHPASSSSHNIPNFFGEEALEGWANVRKAVHAEGGSIVPQLWHAGTGRDPNGDVPNPGLEPSTPSGLDPLGNKRYTPMTEADIADLIEAFAKAAAHAERLGFDGVEIHGAHGYLVDSFFWGRTNVRTDLYGGDLRDRTRFAVEIAKSIRARVRPDFPVIIRLSQWKSGQYDVILWENAKELGRFLEPLSDAGIDIFHMSTRRYWLPAFEGSPTTMAALTKKITGKPVIAVGTVGMAELFVRGGADPSLPQSLDAAVECLERGDFDLLAVGRALLADPEWALKIREGREGELIGYSPEYRDVLT